MLEGKVDEAGPNCVIIVTRAVPKGEDCIQSGAQLFGLGQVEGVPTRVSGGFLIVPTGTE